MFVRQEKAVEETKEEMKRELGMFDNFWGFGKDKQLFTKEEKEKAKQNTTAKHNTTANNT